MDQEAFVPICWFFTIIGEATKVLSRERLNRHPTVDWRGSARFRDVLSHQYFRIAPTLLWNATSVSLPPLDAVFAIEMPGTATPGDAVLEGRPVAGPTLNRPARSLRGSR